MYIYMHTFTTNTDWLSEGHDALSPRGQLPCSTSDLRANSRNNKAVSKQPGPVIFTGKDGHFELQGPCLIRGRYNVIKVLDSTGQSAVLVLAEDLHEQRKLVVIKILHAPLFQIGVQESHVLMELAALDPMNVSHTLRLLTTVVYGSHYCLVLEPLLPDPLTTVFADLPQDKLLESIRKVGLRLLACVGFLHHHNMIHTDLKPENMLLKDEEDLDSVHMVDFGSTIHLVQREVSLYYNDFQLQTPLYRAPEVLFGVPFGTEIDMWSLGCVLAELYLGEPLFLGNNVDQVMAKIKNILGPFPSRLFEKGKYYKKHEKFTEEEDPGSGTLKLMEHLQCEDILFADLLTGLLKYDPEERFTASEAACHPFFASYFPVAFLMPGNKGKMNASSGGLCPEAPSPSPNNSLKRKQPRPTEPHKRGKVKSPDMNDTYVVKPPKKHHTQIQPSKTTDETEEYLDETALSELDTQEDGNFYDGIKEEMSESVTQMKFTSMDSEGQSFESNEYIPAEKQCTSIETRTYIVRSNEQMNMFTRGDTQGSEDTAKHAQHKRKLSEIKPILARSYRCDKANGSRGSQRTLKSYEEAYEAEQHSRADGLGICKQCGQIREHTPDCKFHPSKAFRDPKHFKQSPHMERNSNNMKDMRMIQENKSISRCVKADFKEFKITNANEHKNLQTQISRKRSKSMRTDQSKCFDSKKQKYSQILHNKDDQASELSEGYRHRNTSGRTDDRSPGLLKETYGSAGKANVRKPALHNSYKNAETVCHSDESIEEHGSDVEDDFDAKNNIGADQILLDLRSPHQHDNVAKFPKSYKPDEDQCVRKTFQPTERNKVIPKNEKSPARIIDRTRDRYCQEMKQRSVGEMRRTIGEEVKGRSAEKMTHKSVEEMKRRSGEVQKSKRVRQDDILSDPFAFRDFTNHEMSTQDLSFSDRQRKQNRGSDLGITDRLTGATLRDSSSDSGEDEDVILMSPANQKTQRKPPRTAPIMVQRMWKEPKELQNSNVINMGFKLGENENDTNSDTYTDPYDFLGSVRNKTDSLPLQSKQCQESGGKTKYDMTQGQGSMQCRIGISSDFKLTVGRNCGLSVAVKSSDKQSTNRGSGYDKHLKYSKGTSRKLFKLQDDVLGNRP